VKNEFLLERQPYYTCIRLATGLIIKNKSKKCISKQEWLTSGTMVNQIELIAARNKTVNFFRKFIDIRSSELFKYLWRKNFEGQYFTQNTTTVIVHGWSFYRWWRWSMVIWNILKSEDNINFNLWIQHHLSLPPLRNDTLVLEGASVKW
jgi:hypothetical protein